MLSNEIDLSNASVQALGTPPDTFDYIAFRHNEAWDMIIDNVNIRAVPVDPTARMKRRYLALFDSQPSLQKDSQLQAIAQQYAKELDRDKDFDFETELEAIAALQDIRTQYLIQISESLDWAPGSLKPESEYGEKVLSTTADTRNKAIADLKKFEKKYRGTGAAKESKDDMATIRMFTKSWTFQGEKE